MLAVLLSALADEGVLSLDDPIRDHLPELLGTVRDGEVPRLVDLLSHSTGFWTDKPPPEQAVSLDWAGFCRLLVPRFAPGRMSLHSLLDRVLMLKVAERALGRPVYLELRDRFFAGSQTFTLQSPDGPLAGLCSELHGSLADIGSFLNEATKTSWLDRIRTGAAQPITQAPNVRPWAPVADGLGLFRLANGILGQDGDHATRGFVGLRVSPSSRTAVLGHFASSVVRDHVLNRLVSDLMGVAPPVKNPVLGNLNGFEPGDLPGVYQAIAGMRLGLEVADGQLRISTSNMLRPIPAQIEPDGTLTGRWAAPNLWVESQSVGREGLIGFRFGKNLYVKDRDQAPAYDG
jgi:CubicO group peptidase (beta-lactamase class C family)